MHKRIRIASISVLSLMLLLTGAIGRTVVAQDRDLTEREEFRQVYQLSPGAHVEVSGINGRVDIQSAPGTAVEVYIERRARTREDLEYHKITVEQDATRLVVKGAKEKDTWRDIKVWHKVVLKVPRDIDLSTSGVNGGVSIGEIDGPVNVSGVNGRVEVGRASGYSHISGINGSVDMTIARLGERGVHVSGVNGSVEIRFTGDVNADLVVNGVNGSVSPELPNVTIEGKLRPSNFKAQIGSGGAPISVTGVNGRVRLSRAAG
ncbi:MAG TPA: hypothetical protein VFV34_12885 [Blastocatellia bacterium]|nr:hypothetical protein [Blastocatellia bacterium]